MVRYASRRLEFFLQWKAIRRVYAVSSGHVPERCLCRLAARATLKRKMCVISIGFSLAVSMSVLCLFGPCTHWFFGSELQPAQLNRDESGLSKPNMSRRVNVLS